MTHSGQVKTPKWVSALALQQHAPVNHNITYFVAGQVENDTFTGAPLWDRIKFQPKRSCCRIACLRVEAPSEPC